MNAKKGFFLTVLAMVMLAFMLVSISWWAASVSEQEARSGERFRAEAVKSVLTQISDEEASRFANISSFFALAKIARATTNESEPYYALSRASSGDPAYELANPLTGNVNATIYDLINFGTSNGAGAGGAYLSYNITYSGPERNYTFSSWAQTLSAAVEAVGYRLSMSPMRDFDARQVSPWTVRVRFTVDMNLTDASGSIRMSRTAHADSNLTIDGLLDPMIYRGDVLMNRPTPIPVAERQIFHIPAYKFRDDVKPKVLADGIEGKGWFYGPITDYYPEKFNATMNSSKIKAYILKTTYDGLEAESTDTGISVQSLAESYGGVLLTNKPNETITYEGSFGGCEVLRVSQGKCFDCRVYFMAANTSDPDYPACRLDPSFPSDLPVNPATAVDIPYIVIEGTPGLFPPPPKVNGEYHILFQSKTWDPEQKRDGDKKIYDIEALRDMAVCGFYVQSLDAPSYFQRLVFDSQHLISPPYGIETFVVGQWAGGALMPTPLEDYDKLSRVDRLFYSGMTGQKVRGMMGCKSREMCSGAEALYNATGHFAIDGISRDAYGMNELMCDNIDFANCIAPP
jgi:hypothetical protein